MDILFIRILYILLFADVFWFASCTNIRFREQRAILDAEDSRVFILPCELDMPNAQDYRLSWLYNGANAVTSSRRSVKDGNLRIASVDRTLDDGEFQCKATSKLDSKIYDVSSVIKLNIKWFEVGDIELKSPSTPDQVLPGRNVTFKCGIDGKPRPRNFVWKFKGEDLSSNGSVVLSKSKLTLVDVKLQESDGMYNCCAWYRSNFLCSSPENVYNLHVIDRSEPQLVKGPPSNVYAVRGSMIQLDCVFAAQPNPTIKWTLPGTTKPLANKPKQGPCRKRCIYDNGTLVLPSFRAAQADTYTCNVFQSGEKRNSLSATVTLAMIGDFEEPEKTMYLKSGQNFEYVCDNVKLEPQGDVTWLKDGREVGSTGHLSQTSSMLVIDHPEPSDAGIYTCLRWNIAGNVTFNLTLKFQVRPVVGELASKHANEGEEFVWNCPISDHPQSSVTWYKDGSQLSTTPTMTLDGSGLTISSVTKSDEGKYYCKASNSAGMTNSNQAMLTVSENLKFLPPLNDVCIQTGQRREIECGVPSSASLTVHWKSSNKKTLTTTTNGSRELLVFENPSVEDVGSYECYAIDGSGKVILSETINVDVASAPEIITKPQDTQAETGEDVFVDCTSNNNNLKVTWSHGSSIYRQNSTLSHGRFKVFTNGTLFISSVGSLDGGVYTCSYDVCGVTVSGSASLTVVQEPKHVDPTDVAPPSGNTTQLIQTIALSVSGGVAYVLITVALIVYFRGRHQKKRGNKTSSSDEEQHMLNGLTRNAPISDDVVAMDNGIPLSVLSRLDEDLEKLHYPSSSIDPVTVIGRGEFGEVFLSKAPGLFPHLEEDILVMVKSLDTKNMNPSVVDAYRCEFNQEINTLHRSNHDNVVKLLAVSGDSYLKPSSLITEYLEWGILKLCLQASKQGSIPKFTKQNKMSMCCQIACGLEHLNKMGLLHRDLAARNCVVSSQLLVKISMLGLSVEGFENEYVKHDGRLLPVRWMAPECIEGSKFSMQSEVWSFGVTCWEIFNLGKLPFNEFTDQQFISMSTGDEPPQLPPLEGSKRFTSLISKCCQATVANRPDIKQITKKLQSITGEVTETVQADVTNDADDD